jgi:hypothetical protein
MFLELKNLDFSIFGTYNGGVIKIVLSLKITLLKNMSGEL